MLQERLRASILNLWAIKKNVSFSLALGVVTGIALIQILPFLATNFFFLAAFPLICIFFILMVANIRCMLVFLIFVRVLLDPLLNYTKLNILGEDIGIGGVINLLVILLACFLFMRNPKYILENNHFRSWIVFLSVCAVAITYSPVVGRALRLFLNLLSYMCMAAIAFFIVDNENKKRFWLKLLLFASFLPICWANLDLLKGGSFYADAGMRIQGTFTHPNILAFYLVLIIILSFYILKSCSFSLNLTKRNILRIYITNLLILLLATKTRSAWIACWAAFFIYGLLKERRYLFISTISAGLLLLNPTVMGRARDVFFNTTPMAQAGLNSFAWRLELWKSSLQYIKEKIIFGHGLASFKYLSRSFSASLGTEVAAHNIYLETMFELGLFGLFSYLAVCVSALKVFYLQQKDGVRRLSAEYIIAFSYLISYMIVSLADNMFYYLTFNWYCWFFIGILLKGLQLSNEKKDFYNNTVL
jgi:O-antigen ligase